MWEELFHDETKPDTLLNPILLVEVLSGTTEAHERGMKFVNYRQIPSLQEYVLVSQTEPRIESHRRQSDGKTWMLTTSEGFESRVTLSSIDVDLALADVYYKIVFSPEEPIPEEARARY